MDRVPDDGFVDYVAGSGGQVNHLYLGIVHLKRGRYTYVTVRTVVHMMYRYRSKKREKRHNNVLKSIVYSKMQVTECCVRALD